jgi:uncharacterized OB-fold protein
VSSAASYTKPLPKPTAIDAPYWEGMRRHEFLLPQCVDCKHIFFPPMQHCPRCLSDQLQWFQVSGRGKVWSWVVFHQQYFTSFKDDLPYVVVFIELEEGPRLMSAIVDCPQNKILCDMPVEVVYVDITHEFTIPKFRPALGTVRNIEADMRA